MSDIRLIKYHPCAPHSLSLETPPNPRAPNPSIAQLVVVRAHQYGPEIVSPPFTSCVARPVRPVAWLAQGFPWPLALFLRGVDAGDAPARAAGLVPGLSASSSASSSSALGTWP